MTDLGKQQSQLRSLIDSSPQLGLPPKLLLEEESENKQVQCSKMMVMVMVMMIMDSCLAWWAVQILV